jgi:hypothetical protein
MLRLKNFYYKVAYHFCNPAVQKLLKIFATLFLVGFSCHASATDLLDGTESNLLDTLNGTGKKYLYISECLVSLLIYIKTKNVMVLVGIMIVAVFFNVMIKMAA